MDLGDGPAVFGQPSGMGIQRLERPGPQPLILGRGNVNVVERLRLAVEVIEDIGPHHPGGGRQPGKGQIFPDGAQRRSSPLHKNRLRRPPTEGLDPHLPGPGKEVQKTAADHILPQDTEEGGLGPVGNGTGQPAGHRLQPATLCPSCNHSHQPPPRPSHPITHPPNIPLSAPVDKRKPWVILNRKSRRRQMAENLNPSIEEILAQFRTAGERELVRRAYDFAVLSHSGQFRKSGEPYINHVLAVAGLLADLRMDAETVAAGLLHDVVEDCGVPVGTLEEQFGPVIASLVDGVTKLQEINRLGRMGAEDRDERELESLRKTFLAMARDVRVMLIKLADRLHNMRTLDALPPDRQLRIARETMEIHAPLANRLGIWRWKGELEDLAFRYLQPEVYHQIASQLAAHREEREKEIEPYIAMLDHHLRLEGIEARITGRPKHIYSIYRKMQRKQIPLERVYDIRAVRVIVDTIPDCYHVLGIVHNLWTPIPGEFDDYIATPKENMYQSLHTTVVGMNGKTLEVQIRTYYMHRIAEYGIAAHWRYKEGTRRDREFEEKIAALRAQIEARSEAEDAREFVEAMQADLFEDRVYVFTPKGKIIDLPAGATPIDFAYYVHTEIGHRCRGAKVNGLWVPLDYVLKTGDQVEIITAKRASPSRDWLNPDLGYVRTARARTKIRRWFRQQDRDKNISLGRAILERELKRLGLTGMAHEKVASLMGYENVEDFLAAIGFGDINSQQIASRVVEVTRREAESELEVPPVVPARPEATPEIHVLGTGGLLTRLGRCCNPIPNEPIVGYVTRGRGITVHRRECPNVLNVRDPERLIEVSWGKQARTFPVLISVLAYDRTGLLHDISGVFAKEGINISNLSISRKQNLASLYITLEVTDIGQLGRVLARINKVPNVIEAQRQQASSSR